MRVKVNDDKELVAEIRAAIKEHDGHCCCESTKTSENKCMCKAFREQIQRGEPGFCHCMLYEAVEE